MMVDTLYTSHALLSRFSAGEWAPNVSQPHLHASFLMLCAKEHADSTETPFGKHIAPSGAIIGILSFPTLLL